MKRAGADLDTLLAAIRGRADRAPVRIKIVDLDGKTQVISLKVDRQYWSTAELAVGPGKAASSGSG